MNDQLVVGLNSQEQHMSREKLLITDSLMQLNTTKICTLLLK